MTALDVISAEIGRDGPMSFSRYMELALYHPDVGFYATGGAGRRRDFITSAEVGPLFGAVVAGALDSWWDELGRPDPFVFVEAGAGPGTLARAILRARPRCRTALEYVAVEISAGQRALHPEEVTSLAGMPDVIETGVIFANELLDNMPFDIVRFVPGRGWFEVKVDVAAPGLGEVLVGTDRGPAVADGVVEQLDIPLQTAATRWVRAAHRSLRVGRIIVVDYAVPSYPVPSSHRWLRTYSAHAEGAPPLEGPGTQDITADVDISALATVCVTDTEQSQGRWLRDHGIDALVTEGKAYWIEHAGAPDLTAMAMRSRVGEAEALLDPSGLGGFTVLEWRRAGD